MNSLVPSAAGAQCRRPACWLVILAIVIGGLADFRAAAEPQPAATSTAASGVRIVLVGDSTVTDSAGWGRAFADMLLPTVRCTNTARGGQSTKSFLDSGNWAKALALHPTYVLIQFGHNDQPGKGPNRETDPSTTYRANLIRYVDEARAAGAQPILVTSLTRRGFRNDKLVDSLGPYAEAMKAVAAEKHVPLVDLHARSIEAVERLGPVASEELGPLTKDGKRDHTHLAEPGKVLTARLVVAELRKVAPDLTACFRPTPEVLLGMNLYDLTRAQLGEWVASRGGGAGHAARVWRYLYREGAREVAAMGDLPARLRSRLADDSQPLALALADEVHSADGLTQKYLLELADGRQVETVLMRMRGRMTACLSSQVGCALGCVFCATGQIGFGRNLSTGEIVAQAFYVATARRGRADGHESLRNIVLMGMGEPLLNYDAVVRAMEILRDPGGLAIGAKQITLSTVGVVPGIVRLADEAQPCSLAVSLHAANQDERQTLVPAAGTWPLDELLDACRYYTSKLDRRIFFEWTLIEGRNDSARHAHALARVVRGIPAQINLIPLNPTVGYHGSPGGDEVVDHFRSILRDYGLPVSIRQRRGIEIAAGCGQLAGR